MTDFALNRNSYLHSRSSVVKPRILNRSVDLARNVPLLGDCSYWEPPCFRLSSEQPDIPFENTDLTRRRVAFGRWALPKLRREIHHPDPVVAIQALLSLCDLVHDPERAYEAIRLKIVDRVADKLQDPLPPIREATALLLSILAQYADGKEAIVKNSEILENLMYGVVDDQISVRLKVAKCCEMLATSWMVADVLVEAGLLHSILGILERDELEEILEIHLDTLKSLMCDCGKCIALKNNAFRILLKYLDHPKPSIVRKTLDCLAILTSTKKGKKLAIRNNLLQTVAKLLHYSVKDHEMCIKAATVIMFCSVKTRAKYLAAELRNLPKRLIKLASNPVNISLQMFCLKALTNICEHPLIRKEVLENHLEEVNKLQVDPVNKENKKILMDTIGWVPQNRF